MRAATPPVSGVDPRRTRNSAGSSLRLRSRQAYYIEGPRLQTVGSRMPCWMAWSFACRGTNVGSCMNGLGDSNCHRFFLAATRGSSARSPTHDAQADGAPTRPAVDRSGPCRRLLHVGRRSPAHPTYGLRISHTPNTFITSSPRWLMTFTAMRLVEGFGKGREVSLCSVAHASGSISAFRVVLRDLYGSPAPRK